MQPPEATPDAAPDATCAVLASGAVRCWGEGVSGRLGYGNADDIGDDEPPSVAGDVPLGGQALWVSAGTAHTGALLDTRAVRCWGYADSGQLGYGNTNNIGDNEFPESAGDVPLE